MTLDSPRPLGSYVQDHYEVVAEFTDVMPTGVTVSDDGRVFVSFPRWGDDVPFTAAEIVDGAAVAFPSTEANQWTDGIRPTNSSRCRVSSSTRTAISGCWTRVRRRSRPTSIEDPSWFESI